jgi:hypothetical protein
MPSGEPLFEPRIVAAEHGPLDLITGVSIIPQDSIDDIEQTDIVFVPNPIVWTPEELHALGTATGSSPMPRWPPMSFTATASSSGVCRP